MKCVVWNCRGTNSSTSPTIPYVFWLIKKFRPTFCFLSETKSFVARLAPIFAKSCPSFCAGVDVVGARGGLLVLGWSPFHVVCLFSSPNVVFCKWVDSNDISWYIAFVYGALRLEDRLGVWTLLSSLLVPDSRFLVMGDFNQLDLSEDKLGGSPVIRGWDDFLSWKMTSHLFDVPYSGPRFTWSNMHTDDSLILECLDRAYIS